MIDTDKKTMLQQLEQLQREAAAALAQTSTTEETRTWYGEYLGAKGRLTVILRNLRDLSAQERPLVGKLANEIKVALTSALEERQAALELAELEETRSKEHVDVTLPGRPLAPGKIHPTTRVLREMYAILGSMGFQIYDGPEVESDEYNFQFLNMPPGHPARDMWDTFYTTNPEVLLRTHTSPGQIRAMREYAPETIRVILPGKCYR